MNTSVPVAHYLLTVVVGCFALAFTSGCSSTDSTQPRPLPSSVMEELNSRSARPEMLGFELDPARQTIVRGPATTYHAPSNAISLPFSLERGWPAVTARLNGTFDAILVVDTGASVTSLAGRTAASARVRTIGTNYLSAQLVRGVGGTERTVFGLVDRFSLGELNVTNMAVNVRLEETPGTAKPFGRGPRRDNLLGLRPVLLGSSYITIDYPHHVLTISPRGEFPAPAQKSGSRPVLQVPFEVSNDGIRVVLGFPNGRRGEFVVDTGFSGEILMSTRATQLAGLDDAVRQGRQGAVRGIGGETLQIAFTLDWIELGGRRFGYVKASTGAQHDLIGSGWLRQFSVTFDFKRRVMWLE